MFIKIKKQGNNKYQMLVEGYRDKDGKVKHRVIKYLGAVKEEKNRIENKKKEKSSNRVKKLPKN